MRTCTVCRHNGRDAINAELLGGKSLRNIAARWSLSKTSLIRHKKDHLPAAVVKAAAVEEEINGGKLLDRLTAINRETTSILREARTAGTKDNQLALKAIARVEKQLVLEGQLLRELNEGATVNITLAPEWQKIRTEVLLALEPYPVARMAVAKALIAAGDLNNACV